MEKQNLNDKKLASFFLIMLVVFLSGMYLIVQEINPQEIRKVTVTGSAEHLEMPNLAYIYLTIETRGVNAEESSSLNSEITKNVKDSLYGYGLGEKDLETTSYFVNPVRKWEDGTHTTIEYETRHSLKIVCRDIDSVGSLIDLAIKSGANRIDSVSFGLNEEREGEVKNIILQEASKDARIKAEILAESLNAQIKRVHKISEVSIGYVPVYRQDMLVGSGILQETYITPGEIKTSVSVIVEFELS